MTDGAIHDMPETTDLIVQASTLPISIIIIGIGDSHELEKMQILDSDDRVLWNRQGIPAAWDIVQFVKMNDYQFSSKITLEEEVLKEVPN